MRDRFFEVQNCDRCGKPLNGCRIMSMYNHEVLCMDCKDKETKREDMKNFLAEIKKDIPFAEERVFTALIHPERYNLFDKFEAESNALHEKSTQKQEE